MSDYDHTSFALDVRVVVGPDIWGCSVEWAPWRCRPFRSSVTAEVGGQLGGAKARAGNGNAGEVDAVSGAMMAMVAGRLMVMPVMVLGRQAVRRRLLVEVDGR